MAALPVRSLFGRFLARLKFPQLFTLAAALFFIDLVVPDLLPFVDEILLAAATLLLGSWQEERHTGKSDPKPPIKDVTPPRDGDE